MHCSSSGIRNIFYTAVLLLLFVLAGLFIKIECDLEDYKKQLDIKTYEYEKRFDAAEKDIRILKTDSYINTNGFEGEEND